MTRDFSEAEKQKLLELVKQVESEKWCDFTDWLGDRWCDFEAWMGMLDIKDYICNINTYHKKVIDKNNTTTEKIDEIFNNVNTVSTRYKSRYLSLLADLREYNKAIDTLSEVINPVNGCFTPETMRGSLKTAINRFLALNSSLLAIGGDGLTKEQVEKMEEDELHTILDSYGSVLVDCFPDMKLNSRVDIPIGAGINMYYNVSGKIDNKTDVEIEGIISDQRNELKEISVTSKDGVKIGVDKDGAVLGINSGTREVEASSEGISVKYSNKNGLNTYSSKYSMSLLKFTVENSVKTEVNTGDITSAIGIEYSNDSNWRPLPVLVEVESPYTCQIPKLDVDWKVVGGVAVVGAAAAACFIFLPGAAAFAPALLLA